LFAPGRCVLSYPNDALSDDIDALISGADALSAAADSVATISAGTDVLVSNFDHVEEVFDNLQTLLSELKSGRWYMPVGSITPFAGISSSVPGANAVGGPWLVCDGRSYASSGASADLQTVLNAAGFSALPDLQGKVIAGVGTILGSARSVGASVGAETLPAHTHPFSGTTASGDWNAVYNHYSPGSGSAAYPVSTSEGGGRTVQGAGGGHTHAFSGTTGSTGTGSHGVVQPTVVLNYIIKN